MSATTDSPPLGATTEKGLKTDPENYVVHDGPRDASLDYGKGEDILGRQDIDPALNAKMHIVNDVSSNCSSATMALC
jgi:hypothetical protein